MTTLMFRTLRLGLRVLRQEGKTVGVRKCHSSSKDKESVLRAYTQKLLDNPLPLGAGALVVGLVQWKRIRKRNEAQIESSGENKVLEDLDWQVAAYKTLPLRHLSRLWGFINDIYLPLWTRSTILGGYAKAFGCDLSEAEVEDISHYSNLGEFFRRKLKCTARPISSEDLVSPCDGKVLHFGEVDVQSGLVEQVKGVTYSLTSFLGSYFSSPPHALPGTPDSNQLEDAPRTLHQCVIYLAPGDYHCFHSPVDWNVKQRRHFPGELLSVHPKVVGLVGKLFQLNERVVYLGEWEHGFFSMTAVGATNVGSIKVPVDEELNTNQWKWESKTFHQKDFKDVVPMKKGDYFGEFNLGSTIVLIFEAPRDFKFDLTHGKPVKVGIPIKYVAQETSCEVK